MITQSRRPRRRALATATLALVACAVLPGQAAVGQDAGPTGYAERVQSRSDLLAYWRLGDTTGATARDAEGSRHGTYAGGALQGQPGALGADADHAAWFDGRDDSVVLPTLSSHTSFTIEGWQRLDAGAVGNNVLYGSASGARIMPRPSGFYADAIAGGRYALQSGAPGNTGAWVHWALVRDGATLELYRDGVRVAGRSDLPAATPTNLSGQIGRTGTAYPAKGSIDEVAVYARALTAAEIAGDVAARDVAPGDGPPPTEPPPPTGPLHVDAASRGGACSDARSPAEAAAASTPWCTITRAAQAAPEGATVLVRAATYADVVIDGVIRSARVTFKPFGAEKPVLHGLTVTNASFLRFEGFRITEVTDLDQVSEVQLVGNDISPHDVRVGTGRELLFESNTFHDLTMDRDPATGRCIPPRCGYGVRVMTGVDLTFRGNTFRRIPADGIQTGYADGYVIEGNTFEDIHAFVDPEEHSDAIQFYAGSEDVVLRGNTFRDTRGPLFQGLVSSAPQRDLLIESNVFVRQRDWGLRIFNAPRLRLLNNTVWDARTGVLLNDLSTIAERTTDAVVLNNIMDGFQAQASMLAVEDHNLIASGYSAGAHDIAGPPRFVDPEQLDYRLAGGSPGIDAGTSDGTPATDIVGAGRVDTPSIANTGSGARPYHDLGAFEFTAPYTPPGGSYAARILATPGLLSHWRLGERSGTVAADAKGGRHGSYQQSPDLGQPGALAGDGDSAVGFDGRDDHVNLPALPSSVDFTIEGWMGLASGGPGNNGLYGQPGTLRFITRPAGVYAGVWLGGKEHVLQVGTASNVGVWAHWALVRRGDRLDIYRDGILVGTRGGLPATTPVSLSGTIGRIGPTYPAKASIDEVAVYGAALDATELRAHRDLGAG